MLKKTKFSLIKNHFPICVFSLGLVFFIFLTLSVNAKADGSNTYTLPYSFEDYRSNNSLFPDGFENTVLSDFVNSSGYQANIASIDFNPNTMVIIPASVDYNNRTVYIYLLSDGVFSDTSSISSIYSNQCTYNFVVDKSCFRLRYNIDTSGNLSFADLSNIYRNNTGIDVFGGASIREFGSTGLYYQVNYPIFVESEVYDTLDNLVLVPNTPVWNEQESFQDFQNGLDISSTISNNIDPALNDLQNQKGFFDNLISNLANFFNKLNGWINNAFSFLASNIKNFFGPFLRNLQNRLNTFYESFEDLKDKFAHFFEIINSIYNLSIEDGEFSLAKLISVLLVPSQEDISSAFSGTVFYTLYTGVNTCSKYLYTYVTNLFSSSPNTFVMTLPTFTFGGKEFRGLQISFDWFIPYKTYFDIIVSGFLIMGYIRFLAMWINNFFHGSGFIDHDVNNISARSDSL